jgi:choline dehydrogenase-like flavoprotein
MYDVIIVGSGAAGTAAALQFAHRGIQTCILDVGIESSESPELRENFYSYREKNDSFPLMIGEKFEGLDSQDPRGVPRPAKLMSPGMHFVTAGAEEFSPVEEHNFDAVQSFALGGLANAWGAGLYRFIDRDLEGFSIKASDLRPYYDRLTEEVGISGENDDLTPYFGRDENLQKPLRLSANAARILQKYARNKSRLNRRGFYLGRPRLGVLTEEKDGRRPCDYSNLEFWLPHLSYLYTPPLTLKKLIENKNTAYFGGCLVKSWARKEDGLVVQTEDVESKEIRSFECRNLVLAAGAINSAKLALASRKDHQTRLTLLDNPALQFPFILPVRIGSLLERESFGLTQLNLICDLSPHKLLLQGSILEVTSPARAEFFSSFPFAASDNLALIRYVLPAVVVLQLFWPVGRDQGTYLSLKEDGRLEIVGRESVFQEDVIREVVRIFRVLGGYTFPSYTVRVPSGHSIHYAGTLPMAESSRQEYTCNREGELAGEPGVYVVDGSVLPALPAKNCSFTVMANAMRIADHLSNKIRG